MGLISNDYYIKIFNKEHIILEEVYEISELTYTKTLNGIWKASLTLPRSIKTTEDILQNNNHIEIYRRINEMNVYKQHISAKEELLWWGVIYNSILMLLFLLLIVLVMVGLYKINYLLCI